MAEVPSETPLNHKKDIAPDSEPLDTAGGPSEPSAESLKPEALKNETRKVVKTESPETTHLEAESLKPEFLETESLETESDPWERHLLYTQLIEEAYKNRKTDKENLNRVITLSQKYIDEFPELKQSVFEKLGNKPKIIAVFRMLAITLEGMGEFERAVEICNIALDHGIEDRTKTGFDGRIERILAKQNGNHR